MKIHAVAPSRLTRLQGQSEIQVDFSQKELEEYYSNNELCVNVQHDIIFMISGSIRNAIKLIARYIELAMRTLDSDLAKEAKAIVALALRNGPIEDVHLGNVCPVCSGSSQYSRITDDEMKAMMKSAVNQVYRLLWDRDHDAKAYRRSIDYGACFTSHWDDPV